MIFDATLGMRGLFEDLDTGKPVRWVRWANLSNAPHDFGGTVLTPGEFQAFRADPKQAKREGIDTRTLLYRGRGRLKYTPAVVLRPATPLARPAWLGTPPRPSRRDRCEHYACDRLAVYSTTVEIEVSPEETGLPGFEAARLTRIRRWCSFHYEAAKLLDRKGEVITTFDEVKARPE